MLDSSEEPLDRVLQLLQLLRAACCCCCRDVNAPREPEAEAESLVSSEYDLLLDTALYVWEVARPALARIHSHEWAACRHLLMNDTGQQVRTYVCKIITKMMEEDYERVKEL